MKFISKQNDEHIDNKIMFLRNFFFTKKRVLFTKDIIQQTSIDFSYQNMS
jgi:hypothetical protein